jgi:4-hydroxy-tetrahydrodipicolinate synthase
MAQQRTFKPEEIRGILPPLVTPFRADEEIDEQGLRIEARYMMSQGVHGLVAGGSAGEGYTLSTDELRRIVAITAEEAGGKMPVLAGIIVFGSAPYGQGRFLLASSRYANPIA